MFGIITSMTVTSGSRSCAVDSCRFSRSNRATKLTNATTAYIATTLANRACSSPESKSRPEPAVSLTTE